jgi:2-methylaconitate cis-trans-isomerase PrpF
MPTPAGVPCVLMRGGTSKGAYFLAADLPADEALRDRVQSLRVRAGKLMGRGDVTGSSVPKTTVVAAPREGGEGGLLPCTAFAREAAHGRDTSGHHT